MKQLNLLIFLLVLYGIVFFVSCSKEKEKGTHLNKLDAGLEQNFLYKTGSYWIYRDSVTGVVDSFVVTASNKSETTDTTCANCDKEIASLTIKPYRDNVMDSMSMYIQMQKQALTYRCVTYQSIFVGGFPGQVTYPFVTTHPSYSLNGTAYANVREAFVNSYLQANDTVTYFSRPYYVNEEVGLIKFTVPYRADTSFFVWELVRANVIR